MIRAVLRWLGFRSRRWAADRIAPTQTPMTETWCQTHTIKSQREGTR